MEKWLIIYCWWDYKYPFAKNNLDVVSRTIKIFIPFKNSCPGSLLQLKRRNIKVFFSEEESIPFILSFHLSALILCYALCVLSTGSIHMIKTGFLPCHSIWSSDEENVRGRHRRTPEKSHEFS